MGSTPTALDGVTLFVAVVKCMDRLLLVRRRHVKGKAGQEVGAPGSSRQLAHEGSKVFSPTHRPPLIPPLKYSWYSFMLEAESTPGPK
jgi:hypothetical protein